MLHFYGGSGVEIEILFISKVSGYKFFISLVLRINMLNALKCIYNCTNRNSTKKELVEGIAC